MSYTEFSPLDKYFLDTDIYLNNPLLESSSASGEITILAVEGMPETLDLHVIETQLAAPVPEGTVTVKIQLIDGTVCLVPYSINRADGGLDPNLDYLTPLTQIEIDYLKQQ